MNARLLIALLLVGCGDDSCGTSYPDVCAKYPGRTCVAIAFDYCNDIGIGGIDQVEVRADSTPGFVPGGSARTPSTPNGPLRFPIVVSILPEASFAGGAFAVEVTPYFAGSPVDNFHRINGFVATGQHATFGEGCHGVGHMCLGNRGSGGCGGANQPCCNGNSCNGANLYCERTRNVCDPCSLAGQGCGPTQVCCSGLTCNGVMCVSPCGSDGQPCCNGSCPTSTQHLCTAADGGGPASCS